jgi:hypothetical protein
MKRQASQHAKIMDPLARDMIDWDYISHKHSHGRFVHGLRKLYGSSSLKEGNACTWSWCWSRHRNSTTVTVQQEAALQARKNHAFHNVSMRRKERGPFHHVQTWCLTGDVCTTCMRPGPRCLWRERGPDSCSGEGRLMRSVNSLVSPLWPSDCFLYISLLKEQPLHFRTIQEDGRCPRQQCTCQMVHSARMVRGPCHEGQRRTWNRLAGLTCMHGKCLGAVKRTWKPAISGRKILHTLAQHVVDQWHRFSLQGQLSRLHATPKVWNATVPKDMFGKFQPKRSPSHCVQMPVLSEGKKESRSLLSNQTQLP